MLQAILLLAQQTDTQTPTQSPLPTLLLFIMLPLLFYFLMIKPARQQEKQRQAAIGALKKNDEVVTNSGIIGTVVTLKPNKDEITIESGNSRLRVLKSSIGQVRSKGESQADEEEESAEGGAADDRVQKKD